MKIIKSDTFIVRATSNVVSHYTKINEKDEGELIQHRANEDGTNRILEFLTINPFFQNNIVMCKYNYPSHITCYV